MINATSSSACACNVNKYPPAASSANSNSAASTAQNASSAKDSFSSSSPLIASDYDTASPPNSTPSDSPPDKPVAAKKNSSIWGDPHVDTASGGKFDFNEHGNYNILADKNINLNAKLEGEQGKPTFITEAGLTLGNRQLNVKPDGSAQLGSGPFAIVLQDGQTIKLADGSSISKKGTEITASTPEYNIKIKTSTKVRPHLNIDVQSKDKGVMADGAAPTGILGEGFNAKTGKQKATLLDKNTYQRNGLFDSSLNPATQALSRQNLAEAKGQTTPGTPATGNTNLMFMLQMMTMFINIFQNMFQLLGQGSSSRAA